MATFVDLKHPVTFWSHTSLTQTIWLIFCHSQLSTLILCNALIIKTYFVISNVAVKLHFLLDWHQKVRWSRSTNALFYIWTLTAALFNFDLHKSAVVDTVDTMNAHWRCQHPKNCLFHHHPKLCVKPKTSVVLDILAVPHLPQIWHIWINLKKF